MKFFTSIKLLIFLLPAFIMMPRAFAQSIQIEDNTFYYPHNFSTGHPVQMVGLAAAKLPEDVVETDDVVRAPLLSYEARYGVSDHITAYAGVHTNIVSFHFAVGSVVNYNFNRLGISAGSDAAFWFGKLDQLGFKTSFTGWVLYPNISAGFRFNKFTLSLKTEAVLNLAETSKNGGLKVSNNTDFFNGYTFGIYLEQPLWKDNFMIIGMRSTFLKFYYPMWAAFSTFDRTFYVPEFILKIIL